MHMESQSSAPKGVNKDLIQQFHQEGFTPTQIGRKVGIATRNVYYHLYNLGLIKKKGGNPDRCTAPTSSTPEGESDALLVTSIADSSSLTA